MTEKYTVSYIDSEGEDNNIDGCDNPFLRVKVDYESEYNGNASFEIQINFETEDRPASIVCTQGCTLYHINDVMREIESRTKEYNYYSSTFLDDETDDYTRVLVFPTPAVE